MSKKVLIIEDDLDNQLLIGECLKYESYDVALAGDANVALNQIDKEGLPDLIIMDLTLPFLTPQEFLKILKVKHPEKKTPVLIISGKQDIVEISTELGAQGYLRKPIDIDDLYAKVEKLIS